MIARAFGPGSSVMMCGRRRLGQPQRGGGLMVVMGTALRIRSGASCPRTLARPVHPSRPRVAYFDAGGCTGLRWRARQHPEREPTAWPGVPRRGPRPPRSDSSFMPIRKAITPAAVMATAHGGVATDASGNEGGGSDEKDEHPEVRVVEHVGDHRSIVLAATASPMRPGPGRSCPVHSWTRSAPAPIGSGHVGCRSRCRPSAMIARHRPARAAPHRGQRPASERGCPTARRPPARAGASAAGRG